jgi:hypothetical protein
MVTSREGASYEPDAKTKVGAATEERVVVVVLLVVVVVVTSSTPRPPQPSKLDPTITRLNNNKM